MCHWTLSRTAASGPARNQSVAGNLVVGISRTRAMAPRGTSKRQAEFDCKGWSTNGNRYDSISDMWASEANEEHDWYTHSSRYWQSQEASVNGMLGGMDELDQRDIAASTKFLDRFFSRTPKPENAVALDVGAGIGRVTKSLLLPRFTIVDMLEQNGEYLEESKSFVRPPDASRAVHHRIACGMQDFSSKSAGDHISLIGRYFVIWIQWCIIYLTDDDLVNFLRECTHCLAPNGFICIKDNLTRSGFIVDNEDSSISRSDRYLKSLFDKAGLDVVREEKQTDFPRDIFPVKMYALRPRRDTAPQRT